MSLATRERYKLFRHNSSISNILKYDQPEISSGKFGQNYHKTTKNKYLRDNISPNGDETKWNLDDLRADVVKHPDNLKPNVGEFAQRQHTVWKPGERTPIAKREDNLKCSGTFEKSQPKTWLQGEGVKTYRRIILLHCRYSCPVFPCLFQCITLLT